MRAFRSPAHLSALLLCAACATEPVPMVPLEIDEGVSWALAEHRAATLSELRYRYHLRVPSQRSVPLDGSLAAEFVWADQAGRDVVFDFVAPDERVASVRANGTEVDWAGRHDHLVVPAAALVSGATNLVEIDFVAGDEALNRNEDFLYTLFVPDRAHFSLPLFDQPNLKARYSLTLDIPSEWVAIANGGVLSDSPATLGPDDADAGDGGTRRYEFAETEPLPTYLFAFAVGDFQVERAERDGRLMRMFHRETDAEKVARNRDAIFDLHAAALAWLEDYTGIDYPFGKFDFALIPPFQYGGMEHPGSIFYRESSLMLDESATQSQVLGRASLIAHETAHMWFGDLVTMNWFDDVWTKEVFANFMAAKIVHPSFPEVNHDLRFFLAHHDTAYDVDRTAGANPIRQELDNLNEAGSLYGPIIYQKAPIVMQQLERLVGETLFRDGMREYLETFRYANATWPQLVAMLDRRTETDLAAWSRVWVEEAGRPVVEVVGLDDADPSAAVRVTQTDPGGRGRLWPQQLELLADYGSEQVRIPLLLSGESAPVEQLARPDRPRFLLPNAGGVEYAHFRLDPASRRFLADNLPALEDPLTRGIAWATLWDSVLEGELAAGDWLRMLLRGLASETVEQNTQRLLSYLQTTYWLLLDEETRALAARDVETALWRGVEEGAAPTVQAAYFRAWRSVVVTDDALGRMRRIWARETEVPGVSLAEPDFTALAEALAVREVADAEEILDRQEAAIENPDRLARFRFIRPALSADPAVREAFFDSLSDPANREREPWVLSALGHLHHPTRAAHARRFIRPALEMLVEVHRTGDIFFPAGWVGATLGGHRSPEAAETVRRFLEDAGDAYPRRLREKVLQSADLLYRASALSSER